MKTIRNLIALVAILGISMALAAASPTTEYIYSYVGNLFDPGTGSPCTGCALTGSFTVDTPLAANTSATITPVSFSFSDGRNVVNNVNTTGSVFWLFTNSAGTINAWNNEYFAGSVLMFSGTNPPGCIGCTVIDTTSDQTTYFDQIVNLPGKWTETTIGSIPTPVPEPDSSVLFCLGLFDNGPDKPGVICLSYAWMGDALKMLPQPPEKRVKLALGALKEIYPSVDIASHIIGDPITISWEADPHFLGAFKGALPGHYRYNQRMFAHFMQDDLPQAERGIFIAGDDVSWTPAWVEGAVQTSLNAVWGIIRHFGGRTHSTNPGPGDVFGEIGPMVLPE